MIFYKKKLFFRLKMRNFAEESLRGDASFRKNEGVKVARNGLLKLGHPLTI